MNRRVEQEVISPSIEQRRKKRQDYQKKYRSGTVKTRTAKSFFRDSYGLKQPKKRLAYYLNEDLHNKFNSLLKEKSYKKNLYISDLIDYIKSEGIKLQDIKYEENSQNKIFSYVEIDAELYDFIHQFCIDESGKRIRSYSAILEQVLEIYINEVE